MSKRKQHAPEFKAKVALEVDLPRFGGERLAHFAGLSLEGDWALEAKR